MTTPEKTDDKTKTSLDASIKEGVFSAASSNMVWNYTTPFALHLGATTQEIGFLGLLQSLGSTLAQIPGARIVDRWSRKSIWYSTYFLSRFLWIFAALLLFLSLYQIVLLMILVFLITFFNGLRHPAWTSLMADIVPSEQRGAYFGKRNMLTGIAGLVALMASSMIVILFGFSVLFVLSVIIGLAAIFYFQKIYEPEIRREFHFKHSFSISPKEWLFSIRTHSNFAWFTLYIIIVSFAVAMAAPFYAVIMLKQLDIGYLWYAVIITIGALVTIVSQPYWGRIGDRYGDRTIIAITGTMICFIPFFWIFANNVWAILFIEIYDGFVFGGWSLVIFNFLLSVVPPEKKTSYIANYAFLTGIATVAGTLVSTLLVTSIESSIIFGISGLSIILFISFVLRLFSLLLMPKIHSAYIQKESEPLYHLAWRLIITEPAKTTTKFVGHVYDVKWLYRRLVELKNRFVYYIREKTIWKYRLFRTRYKAPG
ncbi:MAG: MFS transporter [Candidatus Aenigmarchaeota archaeon]|nr:MFS transporter [Candidatus Aenigmarchaeota archaeon]